VLGLRTGRTVLLANASEVGVSDVRGIYR
jgi:hypothetical protein